VVRNFDTSSFVFLSSRGRGPMGRVERRMLRVMAALVERGSNVHLIAAPHSPMDEAARELGAEVAPYHLDKLNYIRTRSRVRKYLQRYEPVVAHSCGYDADLLTRRAAQGLRTRAVNTIPCTDWPRVGTGALSRLVQRTLDLNTLNLADAIVADCARLADRLADAGFPRDDVLIDPPTIDVAEVTQQAEEPVDVGGVSGPLVGYGGRIEESRGLEQLVAASAILDARGVLAQAVIAGEGPLLRSLRDNVRSSRVKYLGWVDSVPAVIKRFTVAVFPSTSPGVPTSLLEAAVLGKPIVASRVDGIAELFEDGSEIRLVTPGDPRSLAAAIAELVEDPDKAAAMGERARHRVIDEYSSAASIERHLALYRRFMKG